MQTSYAKLVVTVFTLAFIFGCGLRNSDFGKPPPETVSLVERFGYKNKEVRYAAYDEMLAKGPDAVPELIEGLKHKDAGIRKACATQLGKLGPEAVDAVPALIEALDDEFVAIGDMAAQSLGKIGPDARDAIPALMDSFLLYKPSSNRAGSNTPLEMLEKFSYNPARNWIVSKALAEIGPAAIPHLVEGLNQKGWRREYWLIDSLGNMGAEAEIAIEPIINRIRIAPATIIEVINPNMARGTGEALASIDPERSMKLLTEILLDDEEDLEVRKATICVIEHMGEYRVDAIPALLHIQQSKGLTEIGWSTRFLFADILKEYPQESHGVLIQSLYHDNASIRLEAAYILGLKGLISLDAIPKLEDLAENDPDKAVREAAGEAIKKITEELTNNST